MRLAFYTHWNDSRVVRKINGSNIINLGHKNVENYFIPDFYLYSDMEFQQSKFGERPLDYISVSADGSMW